MTNFIWVSSFIADIIFVWIYFKRSEITPGKRRTWLKIILSILLFHLYSNWWFPISGAMERVIYRALILFLWVYFGEGLPWDGALYSAIFWTGVYTVFQNIFFGPIIGEIATGRIDVLESHIASQILICILNVAIRFAYFGLIANFLPFLGMIGANIPNIIFVLLLNIILVYSKGTVIGQEARFEDSALQFNTYFILLHIAMLLALIVSEISRRRTIEAATYDIQRAEAESLLANIEESQRSETELQALRHDLKNHAISLQLLLEQGETKEAQEYLKTFTDAAKSSAKEYATGSPLLDGLLRLKLTPAKEQGVDTSCSLAYIAGDKINNYDLCVLMGNVLDNAVEACAALDSSAEKFIRVSGGPAANCQLIYVENSSIEKAVLPGGLPITTKADKTLHGFGLRNVKAVLEKLSGQMSITQENGSYKISLLIPLQ